MTVGQSESMYGFRVPFRMASRSLLDLAEPTHDLQICDGVWVRLSSAEPAGPLRNALRIAIRGDGYRSETDALKDGERWRDIVSRALARLHLAADFGERSPYGQMSKAGERVRRQALGRPVKSDVPGVTTFYSDPRMTFIHSDAEGCRRPSREQSAAVFEAAIELDSPLKPVERLAFDLYSGSFFQPSSDARLLMLMMAIESLLDLQPRSAEAQVHVQSLLDATTRARLAGPERQSLIGSLSWLMNESIGQAGRRLMKRLEPRRYGGLKPSAFFTQCYSLRSALVHGHVPRPSREEVDLGAAQLEMLVGHLLSGDLLVGFAD